MTIKNLLTARDIHGPYVQLLTNLQGENGQEWLTALNRFNRKENPWPTETISVPLTVWKTIVLGIYDDVQHLRREFARLSYQASYSANELFDTDGFTLAAQPMEVDLIVLSVGELGFTSGAYFKKICNKGTLFGLEICPIEVGPVLRLHYNDQPEGETLIIAANAIYDGTDARYTFNVNNDDGALWLNWSSGSPDQYYDSETRFVFVLPRK